MIRTLKKIIITNSGDEINFINGELDINIDGFKKSWCVNLQGIETLGVLDKIFSGNNNVEVELISINNEKFIGNIIIEEIQNDRAKLLGSGPINLK
ncbi:hypothetical protein [Clostridium baratii]|uniref:hypothetical protein n=1 Tax=Clostridium baratii TaxID=1561 RepID=UPI0029112385|nr:hypothetical protein [Clostridium baratii]MDU4910569.1 hypothetical protein [Clostridium baratii]